jgi:hypothetical protein
MVFLVFYLPLMGPSRYAGVTAYYCFRVIGVFCDVAVHSQSMAMHTEY